MTEVTLLLEPAVVLFYTRIAQNAGLPLEQVLRDALFKLAGELSLEAMRA
jgi:antitoxin component of RelBE/YafQ-DinJ toxin-antitoxin module